MKNQRNRVIGIVVVLVIIAAVVCGIAVWRHPTTTSEISYADPANWTYYGEDSDGRDADCFFIAPTVYGGSEDAYNMSLDDETSMANFLGATNMEKGIYGETCRFYAPYYRQMGLSGYLLDADETERYLEIAYADVKDAFEYYLENENEGRPIVIAGFSQGADMAIRLVEDCMADEKANDLLVACYAIGWRITEEELAQYPHMQFATGETDTGVVIAFDCEAEDVTDTIIIPEGTRTLAINPLNWQTDGTVADKSLNKGACFPEYSGDTGTEIPALTGAYIDDVRGALKVTDVTPAEYPAGLSIFPEGAYHIYDYQFFYRNLQENVADRVAAYLNAA